MTAFDECAEVLDVAESQVSHSVAESFAIVTQVEVTFVMLGSTIDQTYGIIPDYGTLWKTMKKHLMEQDGSRCSFELLLDGQRLSNKNTKKLMKESIFGEDLLPHFETMASVIVDVNVGCVSPPANTVPQSNSPQARTTCAETTTFFDNAHAHSTQIIGRSAVCLPRTFGVSLMSLACASLCMYTSYHYFVEHPAIISKNQAEVSDLHNVIAELNSTILNKTASTQENEITISDLEQDAARCESNNMQLEQSISHLNDNLVSLETRFEISSPISSLSQQYQNTIRASEASLGRFEATVAQQEITIEEKRRRIETQQRGFNRKCHG